MSEKVKVLMALTTCPAEAAGRIAESLVLEGLAACVNRVPGLLSIYMWKGAVQKEDETLLLIKTTDGAFEALKQRLPKLHPYELPELVAIPVCAGAENYLDWVRDNVKST